MTERKSEIKITSWPIWLYGEKRRHQMQRNTYKDGWHKATETLSFYVENGKLIKGLRCGDPFGPKLVYPYKGSKRLNCYDNMAGITARYGCWKNVTWR
nr:MAG: hypothetical protein [Bacteriophage sp.]